MGTSIFLVILLFTLSINVSYAKERISCKSINNKSEAQEYYDARKWGWKGLDRDKDGEPCGCLKGGSKEGKSVCEFWEIKMVNSATDVAFSAPTLSI